MKPERPELTEGQIAEYRQKLNDPGYMARAIDKMADDLYRDLTRGSGSDEPKFHEIGKKGIKTEE